MEGAGPVSQDVEDLPRQLLEQKDHQPVILTRGQVHADFAVRLLDRY